MTAAEARLEELETILQTLREVNDATPLLVEGEKDERALRAIGFTGTILRVNTGATVFQLCESISRSHREIVVLTDWDRFGGHLARLVTDAFHANGVATDLTARKALARATRKEITQVESLDTYLVNLRDRARLPSS